MQLKDSNLAQKTQTSVFMGPELRTVGQGLDSLDVEDFDLKVEGDGYFALAIPRVSSKSSQSAGGVKDALQSAWRSATRGNSSASMLAECGPGVMRVLFTPPGLLRLERAGRAKRNVDSAGVPNLKKLGQVLRTVGEHLDAKSGRLLKVSKRGDRIAFEYAIDSNDHRTEEWKLEELYELWLEAFKQRQERAQVIDGKRHSERLKSR